MKKIVLIASIAIFTTAAQSQLKFDGPPDQEDYDLFCRAYGKPGEKFRDDCEKRIRLQSGYGTCEEMEWSYSCDIDVMSDQKHCTAYGPAGNLFVFAQQGNLHFGVIGESYPGSISVIRVDDNEAIRFDEDDGPSDRQNRYIEQQIKSGTSLRTRHIRWPEGVPVDAKVPICNLPTVLSDMKSETAR